jgi:hypothetical protein
MGHANIDVTQNVYGKSWWEGASGSAHPNRQRNRTSQLRLAAVNSVRVFHSDPRGEHERTDLLPSFSLVCRACSTA